MFLPSNITLKFGDSGDFVSELQRRLVAVSCFSADAINGFYDGTTVNGVSQFQSMSGIRADGIAGPETLRRLNGVISGDTSTSSDHKAEEEARAQQERNYQLQLQQQYMEQQALLAQQQQQQAYEAQILAQQREADAHAQHAARQQPQQAPLAEVAHAQVNTYQAQPPMQPQPAMPIGGDDVLARMLLGQQAAQQPQPLEQQATAQPAQAASAQVLTQQQALAQQQALIQQSPTHSQSLPLAAALTEQLPQSLAAAQPPSEAAAQPRGMIGRAVQFMSEKMQQLSNYFESKLPKHVIDEVKTIGMVMAQSGVKEVAVPGGPEPQRGIEGPQRDQQQGQQRG